VKPKIAPSMFPAPKSPEPDTPQRPNTSKRRAEPAKPVRKRSTNSEDFGDDGIDDDELMRVSVGDLEFEHIDNFANPMDAITRKNTAKNKTAKAKSQVKPTTSGADDDNPEPVQLANGKWACNHKCKDKNACKHLCCREGSDKPPRKPAVTKRRPSGDDEAEPMPRPSTQEAPPKQSKLQLTASKRKISSAVEELDLTQQEKKKKADYANNGPRDYRDLHQLHKNIQKKDPPSSLHSVMHTKPAYSYSQGGEHNLSFLQPPNVTQSDGSSDYGDLAPEDASPHYEMSQPTAAFQDLVQMSDGVDANDFVDYPATAPVASRGSDLFGDDDSLLGDAMIGLADSQNLQETNNTNHDSMDTLEEALNMEYEASLPDDDIPMDIDYTMHDDNNWQANETASTALAVQSPIVVVQSPRLPFAQDSSSTPQRRPNDFKPGKAMLKDADLEELKLPQATLHGNPGNTSSKTMEEDIDVLDFLDDFDEPPVEEVPDAFKDLEPWIYQRFGGIVELVDE
jgi:ATP-dependent DNA helicase HFM1/MER3